MRNICEPTPPWEMGWADEAAVQIEARFKNSVCFLGVEEGGKFVPKATGFFVGIASKYGAFTYLVTAEHVIAGLRLKGYQKMRARLNSPPGMLPLPIELDLVNWFFHPNAESEQTDVAVTPVTMDNAAPDNFLAFSTEVFVTKESFVEHEWGLGDEVVVIGLFRNHYGRQRNVPLVRIGSLAALPEEPIKTKWGYMDAYLVELHSVGGLSGSPCYIHRAPVRVKDGMLQYIKNERLSLLGLVSGHFDVPNLKEDTVIEDDATNESINTGVAVVVPAYKILETLNQEELVKRREAAIKHLEDSAATPDLADVSESSDDANPNHRVDFMRLVDVAARKRPQDDRT